LKWRKPQSLAKVNIISFIQLYLFVFTKSCMTWFLCTQTLR